jgi:hypothetical protein
MHDPGLHEVEVRLAPMTGDEVIEQRQAADKTPSPLVQGAGCVGCVFGRFLPFTRACGIPNQYALAV